MSQINSELITEDLIQDFITEATEILDQAEADIIHLDKGGSFKEFYDSIFRAFHSLKGGAGMLGMTALQKHMHSLENILSNVKAKNSISNDEANFFLAGVDAGRQILAGRTVDFSYEVVSAPLSTGASTAAAPSSSTAQAAGHKSAPHADPKKPKPRVYIVDDENEILESLGEIMEMGEVDFVTFLNPTLAFKAIQKTPPEAVLTDMKMPDLSGIELLNKIHDYNPDLPVIIISGNMNTGNILEAIRSGVFAVIEKPFKHDVVLTYTYSAVRQNRLLRMFRKGLNLLLYQFSDLEDFLNANGKKEEAQTARRELTSILSQWKEVRKIP